MFETFRACFLRFSALKVASGHVTLRTVPTFVTAHTFCIYSGFLWVVPTNTGIFLCGLKCYCDQILTAQFLGLTHRIPGKIKNAIYCFQISALVPEIFKFEKCVKYVNESNDDVIYSTEYNIKYINRAISVNLQQKPLKPGRLIVLKAIHLRL